MASNIVEANLNLKLRHFYLTAGFGLQRQKPTFKKEELNRINKAIKYPKEAHPTFPGQ